MSAPRDPPERQETEDTEAGRQSLMWGVRAVTLRDRLACLAAAALEPRAAQKRCDHGLFDLESRRQTDLIDELRRVDRQHGPQNQSISKGE